MVTTAEKMEKIYSSSNELGTWHALKQKRECNYTSTQ